MAEISTRKENVYSARNTFMADHTKFSHVHVFTTGIFVRVFLTLLLLLCCILQRACTAVRLGVHAIVRMHSQLEYTVGTSLGFSPNAVVTLAENLLLSLLPSTAGRSGASNKAE